MFTQHNLSVGDKVRISNVEAHPFASKYLGEGDVTTVIDATAFFGMPCVEVAPTKGIKENAGAEGYGGDAGGVPFAASDLDILTKIES